MCVCVCVCVRTYIYNYIYIYEIKWICMTMYMSHIMCIYIYIYTDIISLQVRRLSLTMSLAKDQVLRGPLVYLGLIELSPFFPPVHRRQVIFPHLSSIAHCAHMFMVSEPQMTTEDCIRSLLNLIFLIETVDAWLEAPFFHHLQITAPNGPFQFAMKSQSDWHSGAFAKQIRGGSRQDMVWICINYQC